MKTTLNFGGFYESIHSELIESTVEQVIEDDNVTEDMIKWADLNLEYSKKYVDFLNERFELNLKFLELNSPKYYNYSTDVIIVEISTDDFKKVSDIVDKEKLKEVVKEITTGRSGYIPFYTFDEVFQDNEMLCQCMFDVLIDEISTEDLVENYGANIAYNVNFY